MKLCQVVAIEKGIKTKVNSEGSELHKLAQKHELFNGFQRRYEPVNEAGERMPDEFARVQIQAESHLGTELSLLSELVDVTAAKDFGNSNASADLILDDEVLVSNAPVPFLLFLEKNLDDVHKQIEVLPVLDPKEDWSPDPSSGLFRTAPTQNARTKKEQRPIVMYDATDKHPAQTQLITEDVTVGHWHKTLLSGALPAPRKKSLLERVDRLRNAVKIAREAANSTVAPEVKVADKLFNWLVRP